MHHYVTVVDYIHAASGYKHSLVQLFLLRAMGVTSRKLGQHTLIVGCIP